MDIQTRKSLTRNLSPIGAWAFALGTSIGWGSLVVTANTYLAQAGPVGSVIGLVLGAIMLLSILISFLEEDRKLALEAGMNGHLAKPYDIPKMLATLAELLG